VAVEIGVGGAVVGSTGTSTVTTTTSAVGGIGVGCTGASVGEVIASQAVNAKANTNKKTIIFFIGFSFYSGYFMIVRSYHPVPI
jgi:hypothetical protein